jgi:cytochrome c-type biogenesis protein
LEWAFQTLEQLANFNYPVAILISFAAGLVTSVNPCMLGMASSILAFQNEEKSKSPVPIILTFMLSFAMTLTLLGIVGSFFGDKVLQLNRQFGSSLYSIIAMVFVLIGLYIIGLRLHHILKFLPFKIVAFYSKKVQKKKDEVHPLAKAYSLGTLFGLTPSPCTTPMIIAMLAYTTVTGSVLLGGILLFAYGIGHGIPFLVIGLMSGTFKRRGWVVRWHRLINKGIGIGLILVGLFFFFYENKPMDM